MNIEEAIRQLKAERAELDRVIEFLEKRQGAPAPASAVKKERKAKAFQCATCPKAFTSSSALGFHQRTKHETRRTPRPEVARPVQCLDCGEAFASKGWLDRHRIKEHGHMEGRPKANGAAHV